MLSPLHEEKVYIRIVSVMPYYLQGLIWRGYQPDARPSLHGLVRIVLSSYPLIFFRIIPYIGDTRNVRMLITMNKRAQIVYIGAHLKTGPTNPQD
jgi:hypothetical protein